MNTVIIYGSKYGATKQYAKWLADELGCDAFEAEACSTNLLSNYKCIIFGGNVRIGKVSNIKWLRKNHEALQGKQMAVFAVGASPCESGFIDEIREQSLDGELLRLFGFETSSALPFFYLRGALRMDGMAWLDKKVLGLVGKAASTKPADERNGIDDAIVRALASPDGSATNWTSKEQLAPLVVWAQAALRS